MLDFLILFGNLSLPTFVTAHTFCASRDRAHVSFGQRQECLDADQKTLGLWEKIVLEILGFVPNNTGIFCAV